MFLSFTLADYLPTHLCRFPVRSPRDVTPWLFSAPSTIESDPPCGFPFRHRLDGGSDVHNQEHARSGRMRTTPIITRQCWNINQLSIDYAFRPRLRTDSPWDDLRCPGTLGFTVLGVCTRVIATYTNIRTSVRSTVPSGPASAHTERSSTTHPAEPDAFRASARSLSPDTLSAQSNLTSELLRFL